MANIHFFVDFDKLPDNNQQPNFGQSVLEAYGPVKNSETTEYRVTSMFKLEEDCKAYAVTSGVVLVQPQFDEVNQVYSDTRVNLILKPFLSPNNGFTDVEFFIYRGLRKDSFLDSNDNLINQSTSNISNLMDEVWNDFLEAKQKNLVEPSNATVPSPNRIGLHIASEPSTIDLLNVFDENRVNQTSNEPIQLAAVNKGWTIGEFDSNEKIGFEIILKDKLFSPSLATARNKEHIITVQNISTSDQPGDLNPEFMREREQILNFIDPCTYFPMFTEVEYKVSNDLELKKAFGIIPISELLQKPFYTKKKIYLDIRNEFGYSMNYHKDNQGDRNDQNSNYGNHLKIMINQGTIEEENYYINYWPIYTREIVNNTSSSLNTFDIALRTQYYPDQLVYVDFYSLVVDNSSPEDNKRFYKGQISGDPNYTDFYESFLFANLPSGYAPSQMLKLIFVRRNKFTGTLPISSIPRGEYLDNLFGPIKPIPSSQNNNELVVERSLGKRYINLSDILGLEIIVEITFIVDDTNVFFLASIIDYNTISPIISRYIEFNSLKFVKGNLISSDNANAIKEAFSNMLELSKLSVNINGGSSINLPAYIFDASKTDKRQFLFGVTLSRSQYNNQIRPAALTLNSSLHDTYINFVGFNKETGTLSNGKSVKYFDSLIRVSGFNNNGDYSVVAPSNGNILVYTFDKLFSSSDNNPFINLVHSNLETSNENAYIDFEDFMNHIEVIELAYLDEDKDSTNNNISVKNTSTRIRVHSYGKDGQSGLIGLLYTGEAFENALPEANYKVSFFDRRNLELSHLEKITGGKSTFRAITSNADENWFRDNPSPYVMIKTSVELSHRAVDLGQIFYGLDSLTIPSISSPSIGYGYTSAANGYPLDIPFDLTGIIANIATPVADTLYHRIFNISPIAKSFINDVKYTPDTPDLFAYYVISAPEADLIANADAVGLSKAYNELKINSNVKLSDVLKLYYQGDSSGFTLGQVEEFYTVERRWIILAKYFNLVKKVGNKYRWMPEATDSNDIQEWSNTKDDLKDRMYALAEFWWNHYLGINAEKTLQRILRGRQTYIERFSNVLSSSELNQVDTDVETILQNFFLPFIKNELLNEDSNLIE